MLSPLQVRNDDIKLLRDTQLVELLYQLINLELSAHSIHKYDSRVPLSIYIPDGGIDGQAKWTDGPESTDWLPSRLVGFQAKATEMAPADCEAEVLDKAGRLKSEVRALVEANGVYALFLGRDCVEKSKRVRIIKFEQAIVGAARKEGLTLVAKPTVRIYDANDIATWTNKYPAAVSKVFGFLRRGGAAALTWGELAGYPGNESVFVQEDEARQRVIAGLKAASNGSRKVTRLLGASGLGKTRLLLEAFRPPKDAATDPDQARLSSSFCYLQLAKHPDVERVLLEWRRLNCAGLVIVDDCPIELHERLTDEILRSDSRLSIITIGNDAVETAYVGTQTSVLTVLPASDELIEAILALTFATLSGEDCGFIARELAQGYPLMALRMAEARLNGAPLTARITPQILAKAYGRPVAPDSKAAKVIAACALFESVGIEGEMAHEREFVRTTFCPDVSTEDFYAELVEFVKSGALTRYGRIVQVRPRPLAIRLAADWWERCAPERAEAIVTLDFPDALSQAFCARLRMLDFVPSLAEVAKGLCGASGPFGQAKVLTSDLGSQLFRAIAEVNPEAAISGLTRALDGQNVDALKSIEGAPRRNIVWALEKLAFWERTFSASIACLAQLAIAENENYSNNATGVLSRLFTVLLSGTQAPLSLRQSELFRMARSDDMALRRIAVEALDKALTTDNFIGTAGGRSQGSSGPLKEYRPKLWQEVFDYWQCCLGELSAMVVSESPLSQLAARTIASHIRGLTRIGRIDDVEAALRQVVEAHGPVWPEALDAVRGVLRYDLSSTPPEAEQRIRRWIDLLTPTQLPEKIRLIVTEAPFEHEESEQGSWADIAAQRAEQLGLECGRAWKEKFDLFQLIMEGGQRQAFSFGRGLALGSAFSGELLERLLSRFSNITRERRNALLLAGWMSGLDNAEPPACDRLFEFLAGHSEYSKFLPSIARGIKLSDARIEVLTGLINGRSIEPDQLYGLSYGQAMSDVSNSVLVALSRALASTGTEGAWVALDILFMRSHGQPDHASELTAEFTELLSLKGLLAKSRRQLDLHIFETVAKRLIPDSPDLGRHIAAELVEAIVTDGDLNHIFVQNMFEVLLAQQGASCWPVLKNALTTGDRLGRWRLAASLRDPIGHREFQRIPASHLPLELLRQWCLEAPDSAPQLVADLVQLIQFEASPPRLSDAVMMLLNEAGDSEAVLSSLSAGLNTFMWSGSPAPFYNRLINLMEPLKNHGRARVVQWAFEMIRTATANRDQQLLDDQEQDAGRW